MKNENVCKSEFAKGCFKSHGKSLLKGLVICTAVCGIYGIGYLVGACSAAQSLSIALEKCCEVNPDLKDMINSAAEIAAERMES